MKNGDFISSKQSPLTPLPTTDPSSLLLYMITDCGSPKACGAFDSLVDKLWDIGRDTGQHLVHQIISFAEIQGVWY